MVYNYHLFLLIIKPAISCNFVIVLSIDIDYTEIEVMMMFKLKDIMEMINIPERTIRRHMKLGLLKGEKVGGTWRFSEDDLFKYLSNHTIQKTRNHIKINEIFDYLHGISKEGEEMMLIKQVSKLTLVQKKDLSLYVNQFKAPFYFDLEPKGNKNVITFKGSDENAKQLIDYLKILQ